MYVFSVFTLFIASRHISKQSVPPTSSKRVSPVCETVSLITDIHKDNQTIGLSFLWSLTALIL